jgi:hypothetical protein
MSHILNALNHLAVTDFYLENSRKRKLVIKNLKLNSLIRATFTCFFLYNTYTNVSLSKLDSAEGLTGIMHQIFLVISDLLGYCTYGFKKRRILRLLQRLFGIHATGKSGLMMTVVTIELWVIICLSAVYFLLPFLTVQLPIWSLTKLLVPQVYITTCFWLRMIFLQGIVVEFIGCYDHMIGNYGKSPSIHPEVKRLISTFNDIFNLEFLVLLASVNITFRGKDQILTP